MANENEDLLPEDEELENAEAGEEEDDGQGEPDGHEEPDAAPGVSQAEGQNAKEQTERPVSRSERRINTLREESRRAAEEAKAARELAAQARRELEDFRAAQQRAAQLPNPREEAERIAAMSPDERAQHWIEQERQRSQAEMNKLRFEMYESTDRAKFEALKASNPIAARLAPKVEEYLANERRQGRNFDREVVMTFLAGQEALARAGKEGTKQRAAGAARIAQNKTRPSNGGSDVGAGSRRSEKSLEDRLDGVLI